MLRLRYAFLVTFTKRWIVVIWLLLRFLTCQQRLTPFITRLSFNAWKHLMALTMLFWTGLPHIYNIDYNMFAPETPVPLPQYYSAGCHEDQSLDRFCFFSTLQISLNSSSYLAYIRIFIPMIHKNMDSAPNWHSGSSWSSGWMYQRCVIVDEVKPSSTEYCQNRSTLVRFISSAAPYPEWSSL